MEYFGDEDFGGLFDAGLVCGMISPPTTTSVFFGFHVSRCQKKHFFSLFVKTQATSRGIAGRAAPFPHAEASGPPPEISCQPFHARFVACPSVGGFPPVLANYVRITLAIPKAATGLSQVERLQGLAQQK